MVVNKAAKRLVEKRDFIHITILLLIALGIGIYLITTTVLIAKDGVFYIERAQKFSSDPIGIIKVHPPGYPFLIFIAHKSVTLFSNRASLQTWIYSAQSVTLLCRLLAIIPLYFIGKLLVGSRKSFCAVLILMILPHSAKYCGEVLREWPYILFLAGGFLFLLWGAKHGKWWAFGLVGLCAGLGYLIRHESTQIVVYGLIWLTLCMFRPKPCCVSRWKILIALALLLIGFAIPAVPYMKCTGQSINPKVKYIMKSFSFHTLPDRTDAPKVNIVAPNFNYNAAEVVSPNVLEALSEIFKTIGENLMWFFMLPLVIGLYYRLRGNAKFEEQFLITVFVLANVTMMVLQHCYCTPGISRRWSLSLIALTIFYVPVGLQVLGDWLSSRFYKSQGENKENPQLWFFILLVVGVAICLPKLFRPIGIDKNGYKKASKWLNENTVEDAIVAVPDKRISFYAERKGLIYDKKVPKRAKYIVEIVKDENERLRFAMAVQEKYSGWVDKRKERGKRLVIYKVMQ